MSPRRRTLAAIVRRWRLVLLLSSPLALAGPIHALAQDVPKDVTEDAPKDLAEDVPEDESPAPPLPLPEIVIREKASDPWTSKTVTLRCTSFYISAAAVERDERPEIAEQYEENAEMFLGRALALNRENRDVLINGLTRLSRMYYVLSEAARGAGGDPYDHPLLRSDFDFCARLAQLS